MIDYKKTQKEFYFPKIIPSVIEVPEMVFIMIDGQGDPNTSREYQAALEILYGLSYSIKMSKKGDAAPKGYFDYVVPPLEGLWLLDENSPLKGGNTAIPDKSSFVWTSMIRQPEFVTIEAFEAAKTTLAKKKPNLDLSLARLERFTEGLCAHIMHIGSYDNEPETIGRLYKFIEDSGHRSDLSETRRHHEIYLGDPRKTAPEKLKTVIRYPIKQA